MLCVGKFRSVLKELFMKRREMLSVVAAGVGAIGGECITPVMAGGAALPIDKSVWSPCVISKVRGGPLAVALNEKIRRRLYRHTVPDSVDKISPIEMRDMANCHRRKKQIQFSAWFSPKCEDAEKLASIEAECSSGMEYIRIQEEKLVGEFFEYLPNRGYATYMKAYLAASKYHQNFDVRCFHVNKVSDKHVWYCVSTEFRPKMSLSIMYVIEHCDKDRSPNGVTVSLELSVAMDQDKYSRIHCGC